jgi:hypothetical protein
LLFTIWHLFVGAALYPATLQVGFVGAAHIELPLKIGPFVGTADMKLPLQIGQFVGAARLAPFVGATQYRAAPTKKIKHCYESFL